MRKVLVSLIVLMTLSLCACGPEINDKENHNDKVENDNGSRYEIVDRYDEYGNWVGLCKREYDGDGNKVKEIEKDRNLEVLYWIEYECNTNDNKLKGIGYDTNGEMLFLIEEEYDANGNEVKEIRFD